MTTTSAVAGELTGMLTAVGLDPDLGDAAFASSFASLDLDSLARVELASRIKGRYGIDIEEEITPESTPADVERLITARVGDPTTATTAASAAPTTA
ncbi:phosphopantetheine-binding protein [Streptomyces sp. TRM64462]|uniref:phosphopantetheine-binding protein n=1 Tax=Streptomyces sp. TRM64462 TaxID=2741726 RepID=UPI001586DA83|nr:phosphopantetheine-binding protein [Streptomyces sp. TRM64462]